MQAHTENTGKQTIHTENTRTEQKMQAADRKENTGKHKMHTENGSNRKCTQKMTGTENDRKYKHTQKTQVNRRYTQIIHVRNRKCSRQERKYR